MSLHYVLKEESFLVCEGLTNRMGERAGYSWSFTPTLKAQLVESIRRNHNEASNGLDEIYNFIDEAVKREVLFHSCEKKASLTILNIPDGFICEEIDYQRLLNKTGLLKRYSKELVLSLEPSRKMSKSCSKQCIVNAAKLHDSQIQFCLRNYNPNHDIHVMMLRCGLVNYFDVDYHHKQALKNYLTDKLTANVGSLILSGVDNVHIASMARTLPSTYFKGTQFGQKSYY